MFQQVRHVRIRLEEHFGVRLRVNSESKSFSKFLESMFTEKLLCLSIYFLDSVSKGREIVPGLCHLQRIAKKVLIKALSVLYPQTGL